MSRLEHDFLGELTIDDSVYYGVQTLRAMNNFHISGTDLGPGLRQKSLCPGQYGIAGTAPGYRHRHLRRL